MPKVLVVDDEEDIGDMLAWMLKDEGFDAAYVVSGEQALERLAKEPWELALVDLKLSTSVTGLDVIRAFREKSPQTQVVAMTGYVDIGLRQETEKAGVAAFFEKPDDLRPEVFLPKIKSLLSV